MSSKMQVLFVKQTGHALAAFTRMADPEGKPSISALVGNGLLVRNRKTIAPLSSGGETLLVLPESLDLAVVEFNSDALVSPSSFAVGGGKVEPLGNITPTSIALTEDELTVNVSGPISSDLKVWAQVSGLLTGGDGKPITRVMEGKIEKTKTSTILTLTITPGGPVASIPRPAIYYVVALVEGQRPFFKTENKP